MGLQPVDQRLCPIAEAGVQMPPGVPPGVPPGMQPASCSEQIAASLINLEGLR